jgi:hypothetical protein
MKRSAVFGVLISFGLVFATMLLSSCGEKDVPVISSEEHIIDYLAQDGSAKELFRTTGFFNSTPYTVTFDSAVITDRVLSRSRDIEVDVSKGKVDHGYLGVVKDADVLVTDRFTLEVTRAYSADTLVDTIDVYLDRSAFFMQLGEYTRSYAGWVMWSVSGFASSTGVPSVIVKSSTGTSFHSDADSLELTDITKITPGSRLLVTTSWTGDILQTCHLISDYGQDGAFTRSMVPYVDESNFDSLSYATPTSNPRYYNEFMVQNLSSASFPRRTVFVVPYIAN